MNVLIRRKQLPVEKAATALQALENGEEKAAHVVAQQAPAVQGTGLEGASRTVTAEPADSMEAHKQAEPIASAELQEAEALLGAGQNAEARLALLRFLEGNDKDVWLRLALVRACLDLGPGHAAEAVEHARAAVGVMGYEAGGRGAVAAHLALGVALGSALRRWPLPFPEWARQPMTEEALAALSWAVQHDPKSPHALYNLACMQAGLGVSEDAMRNARAALAIETHALPEGWALLALLLSAQHQHRLASAAVDAALPGASPSQLLLLLKIKARVMAASGDTTGALKVQGRLLAHAQKAGALAEADAWQELALTFLAAEQPGDARECVCRAKGLAPGSAGSHLAEARLQQDSGDAGAAMASCEAALALDVRNADAHLLLGSLLCERCGNGGDAVLARSHLSAALEHRPRDRQAWYTLGKVNELLGYDEDVQACYSKAVDLALQTPVLPYEALPLLL